MKVNEIFCSLQGEGYFTGTCATFIRLSGCNMKCDFCDTDHESGAEMSDDEIVAQVKEFPARHVVITGGEPSLQLTASLVEKLHQCGKFVQMETNGSIALSDNLLKAIDWITVSPKTTNAPKIQRIDELKVVYDMNQIDRVAAMEAISPCRENASFLQPCDRDAEFNRKNVTSCIEYILSHPRWRLSLQTHKLLDIR